MLIDLTLRCPTCGQRADVCFDHGDVWKQRRWTGTLSELQRMTEHELRAGVNEFTEDDPPPYGHQALGRCRCGACHSIEEAIELNAARVA